MTRRKIAVVGAGIVGSLIARELVARDPNASVLLLDRDAVGCGATRRSAGLHFPRGNTERVRRMSEFSQEFYEKMLANAPQLPIYPVGMLVVSAAGQQRLAEIHTERANLTAAAAPDEDLVEVPAHASTWRVDGAHHADVAWLAQTVVRSLGSAVVVHEGVRVAAIEPSPRGVALYLSAGEVLTVDQLVLAPGPWLAAPAWRDLVAPTGARVKKIVALHIHAPPRERAEAIVFYDEDAFLLPLARSGHWLFSYTCQEWDVDPDVVGTGLFPHNVDEARACLRRYAPELARRCKSGRVFCDAYSPSGEPLVRALDPAGRVMFAGAASGSGYRLGPAMAAEAVDLLEAL